MNSTGIYLDAWKQTSDSSTSSGQSILVLCSNMFLYILLKMKYLQFSHLKSASVAGRHHKIEKYVFFLSTMSQKVHESSYLIFLFSTCFCGKKGVSWIGRRTGFCGSHCLKMETTLSMMHLHPLNTSNRFTNTTFK